MDWTFLLRPDGPHHHVVAAERDHLAEAVRDLGKLRERGLVARWLRGSQMRRTAGLFREFAAALQFTPRFGDTWDDFDSCLNDLEWLEGSAAALIILDADELLKDEDPTEARILFDILAAEHSDLPLHLVYQAEDDAETVLAGLRALGLEADLRRLG